MSCEVRNLIALLAVALLGGSAAAQDPAPPAGGATDVLTAPAVAVPRSAAYAPPPPTPAAHAGSTVIEHHPGHSDPDHPGMRMYWNNGLFAQSENKDIVFHMGGTAQFDGGWYTFQKQLVAQPGGLNNVPNDGATPRRIRFRADGTVYEDFDFFSEVEFINGFSPPGNVVSPTNTALIPSITEVWVTLKDVPWLGSLRVGNQKENLGLEHLNSDRYLEFMERSFLQDLTYVSSFNNGFSPGFQLFNTWADQRVFGAVGGFENINDPYAFAVGDGQYAVTARAAGLLIWDEAEKRNWHVGGAMSHRDTVFDGYQSRIRGLVRSVPGPFLPVYADTGLLNSDSNDVYSLETLFASGRWTVQSEYMASVAHGVVVNNAPGTNYLFHGYYAHVLYFLTDDHRPFNRTTYTTNRVVPKNNFSWKRRTWGAWEVGARYSHIDLTDKSVRGGVLDDVVLGLTWYLNPLYRVYLNYEYLYRHDVAKEATAGIQHAVGVRMALDF